MIYAWSPSFYLYFRSCMFILESTTHEKNNELSTQREDFKDSGFWAKLIESLRTLNVEKELDHIDVNYYFQLDDE